MTLIAIAAAIFKRLNTACLSYDRVFLPLDFCFVHRLIFIFILGILTHTSVPLRQFCLKALRVQGITVLSVGFVSIRNKSGCTLVNPDLCSSDTWS